MTAHRSVSALFWAQDKDRYLLVRRAPHLRAFPGHTGFVGGKVDPQVDSSHEAALFREVKEETGLDLGCVAHTLKFLGEATTPSFEQHRFCNSYYLVALEGEFAPGACEEIESFFWIGLREFFQQDLRGEHLMVPPTRRLLMALHHKTPLLADWTVSEQEVPEVSFVHGVNQIMPLSNTLPPATRTNSFYLGEERKILVDPSPKDSQELQRFTRLLGPRPIDLIFLTHHHPDHHQFAPQLAAQRGLPLGMSEVTHGLCVGRFGRDYFQGAAIEIFQEGDVLTTWCGQGVSVYEVPGHDRGQLALAPQNMAWFLVGDLIQSTGSVVIALPEGDVPQYLRSLQRVIDLSPRHLFPSHGPPVGGVARLAQVAQHRQRRHAQVAALEAQGLSAEDICQKIYGRIFPAALATVRAHVKALA